MSIRDMSIISCIIDKNAVSAKIRIRNTSSQPYYREMCFSLLENLYNDGYLYTTETIKMPGDIAANSFKTYDVQFHGAKSNNSCCLKIFYYKNHSDTGYTQLGENRFFTTGETPVESIEATPSADGNSPMYRPDGTVVTAPTEKGIYISRGRKLIAR
ncbi:MAG: hypothetical protein K2J00_03100, partial [Bacteroidaceae bacterium]|nr:hypothetical protein [Bacteroidaceae bacterium]